MNCPEYGKKHIKKETAQACYLNLNFAWGFFIILCSGIDGGVTEENLKKYKELDLDYYREIKDRKEKMDKYLESFKEKNENEKIYL